MLVRALCLRHLGNRLAAPQLQAEVPMVGRLLFKHDTAGRKRGASPDICLLMPLSKSVEPHVQLFSARLQTIERRGLVIVGIEEVWSRKACSEYAQALWAWPVTDDDLKPAAPDPYLVEDERYAIEMAR